MNKEELQKILEEKLNKYWLKRKKEEKIATAEAGEQMCELRLKKQKRDILKVSREYFKNTKLLK